MCINQRPFWNKMYFDILNYNPKQKASSRSSGEKTHTNPYIYSPQPRYDAFCLGLNFNISKLVYLKS